MDKLIFERKEYKSKKELAEQIIFKILPANEANSKSSIQITNELRFDISRGYVSYILGGMSIKGLISSKKYSHGTGYLYWNKKKTTNKNKDNQRKDIDQVISTILSNLKTNEAINVTNIKKRMEHFKIDKSNATVSSVLTKMYQNNEVKRTDNLYPDGYWYWLNGTDEEKVFRSRKIKLKQVTPVKVSTLSTIESTLKHTDELHKINISLRNRIGNYEVIMDEQADLLRSKDKEIDEKQNTINKLKLEAKTILIAQAEKTVQEDVKESRILLEKTFRH